MAGMVINSKGSFYFRGDVQNSPSRGSRLRFVRWSRQNQVISGEYSNRELGAQAVRAADGGLTSNYRATKCISPAGSSDSGRYTDSIPSIIINNRYSTEPRVANGDADCGGGVRKTDYEVPDVRSAAFLIPPTTFFSSQTMHEINQRNHDEYPEITNEIVGTAKKECINTCIPPVVIIRESGAETTKIPISHQETRRWAVPSTP